MKTLMTVLCILFFFNINAQDSKETVNVRFEVSTSEFTIKTPFAKNMWRNRNEKEIGAIYISIFVAGNQGTIHETVIIDNNIEKEKASWSNVNNKRWNTLDYSKQDYSFDLNLVPGKYIYFIGINNIWTTEKAPYQSNADEIKRHAIDLTNKQIFYITKESTKVTIKNDVNIAYDYSGPTSKYLFVKVKEY